jgi:hypothetical protein
MHVGACDREANGLVGDAPDARRRQSAVGRADAHAKLDIMRAQLARVLARSCFIHPRACALESTRAVRRAHFCPHMQASQTIYYAPEGWFVRCAGGMDLPTP